MSVVTSSSATTTINVSRCSVLQMADFWELLYPGSRAIQSSKLINCGNKSKSFLSFINFIVVHNINVQVLSTTSHSDVNPNSGLNKSINTHSQQLSLQLYCTKEFVYTGKALRTDSWQKCGSYEGGAPGGMMCTTHKNGFFFLFPFSKSHQLQPVESFKNGFGVIRALFYG